MLVGVEVSGLGWLGPAYLRAQWLVCWHGVRLIPRSTQACLRGFAVLNLVNPPEDNSALGQSPGARVIQLLN
jgi:hypothetical protein